jgi:methionyl-tRNA synthetase
MPDTAEAIQALIGQEKDSRFFELDKLRRWGLITTGAQLPKSRTLFPRIDKEKLSKAMGESDTASGVKSIFKPEIDLADFQKIDLRVAKIIRAEAIPKAKKLIKLEIDLGEKRTIVAGIAEHYNPAELVGRQVVVVANLKPAKIMGVLSRGMLLAAVEGEKCSIVKPDMEISPGTTLS